jgi:hypothetical protein
MVVSDRIHISSSGCTITWSIWCYCNPRWSSQYLLFRGSPSWKGRQDGWKWFPGYSYHWKYDESLMSEQYAEIWQTSPEKSGQVRNHLIGLLRVGKKSDSHVGRKLVFEKSLSQISFLRSMWSVNSEMRKEQKVMYDVRKTLCQKVAVRSLVKFFNFLSQSGEGN